MTFIERLTELMKENGLTRGELCEKLEIGKNQIKYWEDKDTLPNGETLIKMATLFDVSVDYLLGRVEDKKANKKNKEVKSAYISIGGKIYQVSHNGHLIEIDPDDEYFKEIEKKLQKMRAQPTLQPVHTLRRQTDGVRLAATRVNRTDRRSKSNKHGTRTEKKLKEAFGG